MKNYKENFIRYGEEFSRNLFSKDLYADAWKNKKSLVKQLKEAKKKNEPFSFIRIGDGEGRILGYPDFIDEKVAINGNYSAPSKG